MKKFLLLFVGLGSDSPDQTASYAKKWMDYMSGLAQKSILESGLPLESKGKIVVKDVVSDFQPQKIDIGGYMILKAASLDEAVEIAKQAPHMALGGTTIVRPCLDIKM